MKKTIINQIQTEMSGVLNNASKQTIDNIRRILSSFFTWVEDEDYILKSPVRRIHKIKTMKQVKETYSDEALERLRDNCKTIRDFAAFVQQIVKSKFEIWLTIQNYGIIEKRVF